MKGGALSISKGLTISKLIKKGVVVITIILALYSLTHGILNSLFVLPEPIVQLITSNKLLQIPLKIFVIVLGSLVSSLLVGLILVWLPAERPLAKLISKKFRLIGLIKKIQKGGEAFPEVTFFYQGDYCKGILMCETDSEIQKTQGIEVSRVWEVRPGAHTGKICYPKKESVHLTGRMGWDLINETVFGYGAKEEPPN